MSSIFNDQDCQQFITRINRITSNTQPLWGKMNSTQVMGHCRVTFDMATGKCHPKRPFLYFFVGKIIKYFFIYKKPFNKNLPTIKEFILPDNNNFEEEKNSLIKVITDLNMQGPIAINAGPHPFFGKLTRKEWDICITKHLNHHLEQFGV